MYKKLLSGLMTLALVLSLTVMNTNAAVDGAGTYNVDATLSCYVNAMGGVEFSDGYGLLEGTVVEVQEDGTAYATLTLGKTTGLSIYGIACTAFIGADETPGIYVDGVVSKEGVTYTVSEDTLTNASGEVNYINSITVPVSTDTDTYTMWLYIDSNVMGCQLGDGTGTGASNTPGVSTKHTSTFTIDWSSADKIAQAEETTNQSSNVEMNVQGGYVIEIPSTIDVDANTLTGTYSVTASKIVIEEGAYITVTADETGTLVNGSDELSFTNTLEEAQLTATGDSLEGTITVNDSPKYPGKYNGTVNFVISYFKGE